MQHDCCIAHTQSDWNAAVKSPLVVMAQLQQKPVTVVCNANGAEPSQR